MSEAIDPRLLDAVAACLCWAEFAIHRHRPASETPMSYWAELSVGARERYYRDATKLASAMMRNGEYAVVPTRATDTMKMAASHKSNRDNIWNAMVAAARTEMNWRTP